MNRPTETITAIVTSIVGASVGLILVYRPEWAEDLGKATPFIITLLAWLATGVTYFVARRLRRADATVVSARDGSIQHVPAANTTTTVVRTAS